MRKEANELLLTVMNDKPESIMVAYRVGDEIKFTAHYSNLPDMASMEMVMRHNISQEIHKFFTPLPPKEDSEKK